MNTIDIRFHVDDMDAIRDEALRIIRESPPEGPPSRWIPRVHKRAAETVRRRRHWRQRTRD